MQVLIHSVFGLKMPIYAPNGGFFWGGFYTLNHIATPQKAPFVQNRIIWSIHR